MDTLHIVKVLQDTLVLLRPISEEPTWIIRIGIPAGVAVIIFVITDRLSEWKKRRNDSILGLAILDGLLEEVRNALLFLETANRGDSVQDIEITAVNWHGMETIPDSVLLRILSTTVTENIEQFKSSNIRSYCRKFFEDFVPAAIEEAKYIDPFFPKREIHLQHTISLLDLLERCRYGLNKNSHRWLFTK